MDEENLSVINRAVEIDVLIKLLIKKGIISKEELLLEVKDYINSFQDEQLKEELLEYNGIS